MTKLDPSRRELGFDYPLLVYIRAEQSPRYITPRHEEASIKEFNQRTRHDTTLRAADAAGRAAAVPSPPFSSEITNCLPQQVAGDQFHRAINAVADLRSVRARNSGLGRFAAPIELLNRIAPTASQCTFS